jgi:hypothetical protein
MVASGCGPRPTRAECDQLLDRYVELLLLDDRPGASAGEVLRLQEDARNKARRDPAFEECGERVSRSAYDCAMSAKTADKLEQCLL